MRICIVGTGVIGSLYGQLFAEYEHDVTHLVRPGSGSRLAEGMLVDLLDCRGAAPERHIINYRPQVIEALDPERPFDVILVSVRHDQLASVLPVLAEGAGTADIVFFNNLWTNFEPIDALLEGRYCWGFPGGGGGFVDGRLEAALLDEVVLGDPNGTMSARMYRLIRLFETSGLYVSTPDNILDWLWVHFVVEAGFAGTAIGSGGVEGLLSGVDRMAVAIGAIRDGLAVAEARGVQIPTRPEAQMYFAPEYRVATSMYDLLREDTAMQRILHRHISSADVRRIYKDLISTARALDVSVPVLERLAASVEPQLAAVA